MRRLEKRRFDAVLLDLDGVVTRTAELHARAWQITFDRYLSTLRRRGEEGFAPFDPRADYLKHVDGRPRYDGVRRFLESRGLRVPEGKSDDGPERQTVRGLGNAKDGQFMALLARDGVRVYEDAVRRIRDWRAGGLRTAVVSSSRNCADVLRAAGLTDLFDVRVDGVVSDALGLRGKPDPDVYLEAARRLAVDPPRAVIIEDAEAGVRAGKAGGFGRVVGVDRSGRGGALGGAGADLVVSSLLEIEIR
ncbi:MAG: HAD family hydrolase [Acidobacteriota bacterium]